MTEREASALVEWFKRRRGKTLKLNDKGIDYVIKALEKQIAKKPFNKKYSFFPHSSLVQNVYGQCPVCKSEQVEDEYCANCGQKLDWSEDMHD